MKTIDQITEELGISRATVYRRFRYYGLSVADLKGKKQGRTMVYNDDACQIIAFICSLGESCDNSRDSNANTEQDGKPLETEETQGENGAETCDRTRDSNAKTSETAETEAKIKEAEARAAAETARAERAEAQNAVLLQTIDKLTDAIRAAEAVQAAQLARLPAPAEEKNRGGLLGWWRNRTQGKERKE